MQYGNLFCNCNPSIKILLFLYYHFNPPTHMACSYRLYPTGSDRTIETLLLASCQFHRRSLLRTFGPEKTSGSFGICGICVKAESGWPLKDSHSYSNWWNRPKGVGRKSIKERHYSCIVLEFFRGSMVCRLDHMVTHGKSSSGARFGSL